MKRLLLLYVTLLTAVLSYGQITQLSDNEWLMEAGPMSYKIGVKDGQLFSLYYGPRLSENMKQAVNTLNKPEIPVRGSKAWDCPVLEVVFKDGVRDVDLQYVSAEIAEDNILRVRLDDRFYPLSVYACYKVFPECGIIEKWTEVKNRGKKDPVLVENLQSGSLWLPKSWYELTQISGIQGNEFQPQTSLLTQGVKTIQCRDFRSFGFSYFAVRPEGERDEFKGNVWFGQLEYSGAWKVDFEKLYDGGLQICGGIRFWDSWINLRPGDSFTSPKMCFGFTDEGTSGVSRMFADFLRSRQHLHQRQVIYNSWYLTRFDVTEAHQLELARAASEIGAELFVLDDGWFKGRFNPQTGLGDWVVDEKKFPGGLDSFIEKIHALGMDFGIWVEPEMVNPDSDVYRAHPEWIFSFQNRSRTYISKRDELMLNLARKDVCDHIYKSLHDLLDKYDISYLKWDMNRYLTEPGDPSESPLKQREARIRYVENMYAIIDRLKTDFPDVLFEDCAGGGGRVDMGLLSRMDVAWASDNIDPVDRTYIQYGYLGAFPANTLVSWTGNYNRHNMDYPLEFRLDVAMCGILGISNDIDSWTDSERAMAKEKVALYKEIRNTIYNGTLYRLLSPFETGRSVLEFVSPDKKEAVLFCYNINENAGVVSRNLLIENKLILRGLSPELTYSFDGRECSGEYLMTVGINYPLQGILKSKVIKFEAK